MSAGRRDLFAVLHWTEPQLRSAPQWYIFAVLHLRSGTSSQCSSGQSHIPVVHLRSAPQWCIFAVVHLRSAPVDRATFQWYIFAVLRHKLSTRSAEVRCVSQQIWSEVSEVCERLMDPQSFRVWLLPSRLLFFFFFFFFFFLLSVVSLTCGLGWCILCIIIYGSWVATAFSVFSAFSVLGSWVAALSESIYCDPMKSVDAPPDSGGTGTRTNQMPLPGGYSSLPWASDIASWLSNESMSFLSFL